VIAKEKVMSAPDTNPKKEVNRHRPAMIAIAGSILFGAIMATAIGFEATDTSDDPAMSDPSSVTMPEVAPAN
jgi:hypothetical protein